MHGASERKSEAYGEYVEFLSERQHRRPAPQWFFHSLSVVLRLAVLKTGYLPSPLLHRRKVEGG